MHRTAPAKVRNRAPAPPRPAAAPNVIGRHDTAVFAVDVAPSGKLAASGGMDQRVKVWDVTGRRLVAQTSPAGGWVKAVRFYSKTQVVFVSELKGEPYAPGAIHLWDFEANRVVRRIPDDSVGGANEGLCALSKLGVVAVASLEHVFVWSLKSGQRLAKRKRHPGRVRAVVCDPRRNRIVSAGDAKIVTYWKLVSEPGRLRVEHAHDVKVGFRVGSLQLDARSGQLIAGGGGSKVAFIAPDGKTVVRRLQLPVESVDSLSASFPARLLAVADRGGPAIRVFDLPSGRLKKRVAGHVGLDTHSGILAIAMHPGGAMLVSGGSDGTVRAWPRPAQ